MSAVSVSVLTGVLCRAHAHSSPTPTHCASAQPHLAALRNASHANVRPGSESARVLVGARVRVQNRRWVSL